MYYILLPLLFLNNRKLSDCCAAKCFAGLLWFITEQYIHYNGPLLLSQPLDRDHGAKAYYITVVAEDGGKPGLEGSCSFDVVLEDVNDNTPVFDQAVSMNFAKLFQFSSTMKCVQR